MRMRRNGVHIRSRLLKVNTENVWVCMKTLLSTIICWSIGWGSYIGLLRAPRLKHHAAPSGIAPWALHVFEQASIDRRLSLTIALQQAPNQRCCCSVCWCCCNCFSSSCSPWPCPLYSNCWQEVCQPECRNKILVLIWTSTGTKEPWYQITFHSAGINCGWICRCACDPFGLCLD